MEIRICFKMFYFPLLQAFVEVQLLTGCIVQQVGTDDELANQIKLFTKAVADKPNK